MGAIFGGGIGILFHDVNSFLILPMMIIAGGIGGALWASIPALLKIKFNTNEILGSTLLTLHNINFFRLFSCWALERSRWF